METKTRRRAKMHGKNREVNGGWRHIRYQEVPWLNVSGFWLERAGFKIGDQVEIMIEENKLIIKNLSTDGDKRA